MYSVWHLFSLSKTKWQRPILSWWKAVRLYKTLLISTTAACYWYTCTRKGFRSSAGEGMIRTLTRIWVCVFDINIIVLWRRPGQVLYISSNKTDIFQNKQAKDLPFVWCHMKEEPHKGPFWRILFAVDLFSFAVLLTWIKCMFSITSCWNSTCFSFWLSLFFFFFSLKLLVFVLVGDLLFAFLFAL